MTTDDTTETARAWMSIDAKTQLMFPQISDATKPDSRSVLFLGRGSADRAFQNIQYLVHFPLDQSVPESIRRTFDRIRILFIYGLFQYEFFTVAAQLAEMAYELALGERFVQMCKGSVELRKVKPPQSVQVSVNDLGTLLSLLDRRYGTYPHTKGWRVVDPAS